MQSVIAAARKEEPMQPVIVHLVEAGTDIRTIDSLGKMQSNTYLPDRAVHRVVTVASGRWSAPTHSANMIVSHLSISWQRLPLLVALRAAYSALPLVHVDHRCAAIGLSPGQVPGYLTMSLLRASYALFDRVFSTHAGQARFLRENGLVEEHCLFVLPAKADLESFLAMTLPAGSTGWAAGPIAGPAPLAIAGE